MATIMPHDAVNDGMYGFVVPAPSGSGARDLTITPFFVKKGTKAADKVKAITALAATQGWTATADAKGTVTFQVGGKFASHISSIMDGTGEVNSVSLAEPPPEGTVFDFGIIPSVLASGVDSDGLPSFVEVATETDDADVPIRTGDSAEFLTSELVMALKTDGVDIQFTSPTSFEIIDTSPDDFMNFQITDTNLFVVGAGVAPIPEVSTLLLLGTGLASLLGCDWRRRKHKARAAGTCSHGSLKPDSR